MAKGPRFPRRSEIRPNVILVSEDRLMDMVDIVAEIWLKHQEIKEKSGMFHNQPKKICEIEDDDGAA